LGIDFAASYKRVVPIGSRRDMNCRDNFLPQLGQATAPLESQEALSILKEWTLPYFPSPALPDIRIIMMKDKISKAQSREKRNLIT